MAKTSASIERQDALRGRRRLTGSFGLFAAVVAAYLFKPAKELAQGRELAAAAINSISIDPERVSC